MMNKKMKVAERFTLALSVLLLVSLFGYLGKKALSPSSNFLDIKASLDWDNAEFGGKQLIVPLHVTNVGTRGIRHLKLQVSETGRNYVEREINVEYLSHGTTQIFYLPFDLSSRRARLQREPRIRTLYYSLD